MKFNDFLKDYALYLALGIFSVIVIIVAVFLIIPRLLTPKKVETENELDLSLFYDALGGSANVLVATLAGSRLTLTLSDTSLCNIETLKKHGVTRVIIMQTKIVLLVTEPLKRHFNKLT